MRNNIVVMASPASGGRLRPSLKWQAEHERALKSGPNPSRPAVEAGAVTQFWLKKELPTKKAVRWSALRLGAGKLKAFRVASNTVVSPPESSSPGSANATAAP